MKDIGNILVTETPATAASEADTCAFGHVEPVQETQPLSDMVDTAPPIDVPLWNRRLMTGTYGQRTSGGGMK